jgi:hypothetical protein
MYRKRPKIHTVIKAIREGQTLQSALRIGGIRSSSTWWTWEKNPRLKRLRNAAEEAANSFRNDNAENALLRCAVGGARVGRKRSFFEDGKIKTEQEFYSAPNPVALIFYLTNRAPEKWRDKRAVVNNMNVNNVRVDSDAGQRQFNNEHDRAVADELTEWLKNNRNGKK